MFLILSFMIASALGVIQQLRGQEGGRGSAKSPRLSTQGGVGPLNVHVDQSLKKKSSYFKKYFIPLYIEWDTQILEIHVDILGVGWVGGV